MQPHLICLLGAECTGKTTLAQALAIRMPGLWVPETLRTFCEQRGRTPRCDEQSQILEQHLCQEDSAVQLAALRGLRFVFSDTAPLSTALYSAHLFGDKSLLPRGRISHQRYAMTLLLQPDFAWVADGFQRDGTGARDHMQGLITQELASLGAPYRSIQGKHEQRLMEAVDALLPLIRTVPS